MTSHEGKEEKDYTSGILTAGQERGRRRFGCDREMGRTRQGKSKGDNVYLLDLEGEENDACNWD